MPRITYILDQHPQLSESYASTEMRYVGANNELDVIALHKPNCLSDADFPYETTSDETKLLEQTRAFAPDIIHTHWLGSNLGVVGRLSRQLGIPFTVRSHSFDVLWPKPRRRWYHAKSHVQADSSNTIAENLEYLRSDLCLGILAFPFAVDRLAGTGIPEKKLIPCWPVLDYQRFHDEADNTLGKVMSGGACLPKKDFDAYLDLGRRVPELSFDLYPIGYHSDGLKKKNKRMGYPVNIKSPVQNAEMPRIYKDNEWLVYTANWKIGTVGWPIVVAEAQAAGVGVCMPNLRPDMRDYVGPAGFIYDTLEEVAEIIRQPFPDAMRKAGFEHARKSDIRTHIHLLTDLWK